jgi:glycosyltransferase involved in cell wall biosynthesis
LNSLKQQSIQSFNVILVDYGSDKKYAEALETLVSGFDFLELITCPVSGQLWNKCRAINMALKQATTPYFLVGDIDLIFHPDFIKIALSIASSKVLYFKYGFLSEKESLLEKNFEDYQVYIQGNEEITGTTLFPTDKLLEVNGYDEFYHGWGAEDTDIHIRLKGLGLAIEFYNKDILIKHQWHPKAYRSKQSTSPYHSNLERINHCYMNMTQSCKRVKANLAQDWGMIPLKNEYDKLLETLDHTINIKPIDFEFSSLLAQFKNFKNELVKIEIQDVTNREKQKQVLKRFFNKKYLKYLDMETVNNLLLEEIIKNYRNQPYIYNFDRNKGYINILILF